VVECRLDDVVFIEVGSIGARSSFFMVEVVDFPMMSPKCVGTRIEQGARSSYLKQQKSDSPIWQTGVSSLSVPTPDKGTVGSDEGVLLPAKWCLT
jgi:hypothetical protein